jgi:hypothetical protein
MDWDFGWIENFSFKKPRPPKDAADNQICKRFSCFPISVYLCSSAVVQSNGSG